MFHSLTFTNVIALILLTSMGFCDDCDDCDGMRAHSQAHKAQLVVGATPPTH